VKIRVEAVVGQQVDVTYDIDDATLDQIVHDEPQFEDTPNDRIVVAAEIAQELFDADYEYDNLDYISMFDEEGNEL
jgi:predicted methyltransferase